MAPILFKEEENMANICSADIRFKGNMENLKKLNDILDEIKSKETVYLSLLKDKLNLDYDADLRYEIYYWELDQNKDGELLVCANLAWDGHYAFWDAIGSKLNLKWSGFFEESGYWKRDPLGLYPENFIVEIWDYNELNIPTDTVEFETEKEVTAYLNHFTSEAKTYKEWVDYFNSEDSGYFGNLYEVDEDQ